MHVFEFAHPLIIAWLTNDFSFPVEFRLDPISGYFFVLIPDRKSLSAGQ